MSENIVFNKEQVKELIPHREPFLFVDKVIEMERGVKVVAEKKVTGEEDFFKGHFPGQPVMPGVIIMEALAQAGCILARTTENGLPEGKLLYLVGANNIRWKKPVLPGDTLRLEVGDVKRKRTIWYISGWAYVDDQLVCSGTITAAQGD